MLVWIWVAVWVFISFAIEAMTGFGSIVLALSFGALLMDIPTLVTLLVPLNLVMTGPLVWRHRHHIQWPLLIKVVLPIMLVGTLIGVQLTELLPAELVKFLFACLLIWFAGRALRQSQPPTLPTLSRNGLVLGAGITHGLFASGGPLLVYAISRLGLNKGQFRATLLTVWLTLNATLTVYFVSVGRLADHTDSLMMLLPCVIAGAWAGSALHHRINEQQFLRLVFGLLLIIGGILAISAAWDAALNLRAN